MKKSPVALDPSAPCASRGPHDIFHAWRVDNIAVGFVDAESQHRLPVTLRCAACGLRVRGEFWTRAVINIRALPSEPIDPRPAGRAPEA